MWRRNWTRIKRERDRALQRRIGNAELLVVLYLVGATGMLTLAFGRILCLANAMYAQPKNIADVVLFPHPLSFYMVGGPLAFLIAFLTSEWVHERALGEPPGSFSAEYTGAALPWPTWVRRITVILIIGATLLAILNVRKHATIGSTFLVNQRALSIFPDRYPLDGVDGVEMARYYIAASKYSPARISSEPALFVKFQDGRIWSPLHAELQASDQASIAEAISTRSRKPIRYSGKIEGMPDEAGVRRRTSILASVLGGSILLLLTLWAIRTHRSFRRQTASTTRRTRF